MSFWNTVLDPRGHVPPEGGRLIPTQVDDIARNDPERICFSFPRSVNLADGFRDVNFRTFANAINKTAHFIQREIGRSAMFETVLYMGLPDVRYFIVLVALMKTGHRALFSSHLNSISGHTRLIRRTQCTILLHTRGFPVSRILENSRMETLSMPELDYLLDDDVACDHYPYTQSFEEAEHHPCVVIHRSGSSGLPKPVVWTHGSLSSEHSHLFVPPLDGRETIWGGVSSRPQRTFLGIPIFHGAGITSSIRKACFNDTTIVLGPPGQCTADTFDQILMYANIDAADCESDTLEELAAQPIILAKLGRLHHITYVRGPLSPSAGAILSRHVHLYMIISTSLTNTLVQHETDREDWQYICLNPLRNGIEMRPRGGLYELVFVKDTAQLEFQGVFRIYPRLNEYSMGDLYSRHPTKPHHWKLEARVEGSSGSGDAGRVATMSPAARSAAVSGIASECSTEEGEQKTKSREYVVM